MLDCLPPDLFIGQVHILLPRPNKLKGLEPVLSLLTASLAVSRALQLSLGLRTLQDNGVLCVQKG